MNYRFDGDFIGLALGVHKFGTNHQTLAAHIANLLKFFLEFVQAGLQLQATRGSVFEHFFIAHGTDGGNARSHGYRVAAVSAAMRTGRPFLHQIEAAEDARKRHTGGNSLGNGHNIGYDTGMFHSEPFSGATKSTLNFVKNKQDAVFIAKRPQTFQEGGWWHHITALTEHRLNQNGGNIMRGDLSNQQFFQRSQRKLTGLFVRHPEPESIGERSNINTGWHELGIALVARLGGGQRHRSGSSSVE